MLTLTGISLVFGFFYGPAHREQLAAEAIGRAGGEIVYDWRSQKGVAKPSPRGPAWMRNLLGPHFFDRIVFTRLRYYDRSQATFSQVARRLVRLPKLRSLSLSCQELTVEDLRWLGRLKRLEVLRLRQETPFEKRHTAAIARIEGLRELHLDEVIISPDALVALAALPHLEEINLNGPTPPWPDGYDESTKALLLNDAHAKAIARCSGLLRVFLFCAQITDQGIASLCELRGLETLVVSSPNVTAAGLDHAVKLERLTWLGAWQWRLAREDLLKLNEAPRLTGAALYTNPPIGDDSLPYLAQLHRMKKLRLNSGNVTDAGLHHLHGMSRLEHLDLKDSAVDKLGPEAERLRQALPRCAILLPKTEQEMQMQAAFWNSKFGVSKQLLQNGNKLN